MQSRFRSRRAEIADVCARMRAQSAATSQIAAAIRERFRVNSRVAFRCAHGLTQQQVADAWNALWPSAGGVSPLTHKHISYWEAWPAPTGRGPSVDVLNRLARIYRCRAEDLLDGEDHTDPVADAALRTSTPFRMLPASTLDGLHSTLVPPAAVEPKADDSGGATTDRRAFATTAAAGLAALGVAGPLRHLLTSASPPRAIGGDHLQLVSSVVNRLEQADAAVGGDVFCDFALALHVRISNMVHGCSYSKAVGDGLQAVLGDLEAWIGWLAFDADRQGLSRRSLQEAILRARIANDPFLKVRALAYLSLAIRQERPRESIQCAEAAQRIFVWVGDP